MTEPEVPATEKKSEIERGTYEIIRDRLIGHGCVSYR